MSASYEYAATDDTAADLARAVVRYRLGSVPFALGHILLLALAVVFAVSGLAWLGAVLIVFVVVSVVALFRRTPRLAAQFRRRGFVDGAVVSAQYDDDAVTVRIAGGASKHRYDSVRGISVFGAVVALRTSGGVLVVLPAELVPDGERVRFRG